MNQYLQSAMPWLTILAIVLGPFLAIITSQHLERGRSEKRRKVEIFHTLMRTRSMNISPDHVGALNLVEIEFLGEKNVQMAWKSYMRNLSEPLPPLEEKDQYDQASQNRARLLTELLDEMAKSLKIEIQQLEILRGSYVSSYKNGFLDGCAEWLGQYLPPRSYLESLPPDYHSLPDSERWPATLGLTPP